jgi:hypothetical protein
MQAFLKAVIDAPPRSVSAAMKTAVVNARSMAYSIGAKPLSSRQNVLQNVLRYLRKFSAPPAESSGFASARQTRTQTPYLFCRRLPAPML